jgi:predicted metallopeptidase
MRKDNEYVRLTREEDICLKLAERYSTLLCPIHKNDILVFEWKTQRSQRYWAKICRISGIFKALIKSLDVDAKFIIQIPTSSWEQLTDIQRQWVLFHELMHINFDPEKQKYKLIQHNIQDFRVILNKIGLDGYKSNTLTSMLDKDPISFQAI